MSVVNDFFAKSSFFDADCRCKILAASAVKMLRTIKLQTGKLTASPLFAVCLMDGDDKPNSPDDFFGCPGKTAREAVDEAMELFEGDKIAHVIAPDGQATTIDLLD